MRPIGSAQQLEKRRRRAIRLLQSIKNLSTVARLVHASVSSVFRWQQALVLKGRKGLTAKPVPGRPSRLTKRQKERLVQYLLKGPQAAGYRTQLWTLKRIARLIRLKFHVRYHPGHVWKVLTQLGWSCQKPERRALPRDEAAIAHWKRYVWPQIKKERNGWGHISFFSMKAAFC
jgi:transposase